MKNIIILILLGLSLSGCFKVDYTDITEYATVVELGLCNANSCIIKVRDNVRGVEEYWQSAKPSMVGMNLYRECRIRTNGDKWCFDAYQVLKG